MKKVVITGATSFIGINLIEKWLQESCDIFAIVRPNSKNINRLPKNDKIHVIQREMSEYGKLVEDIDSANIFYHLAWEGTRAPYRDNKEIQKKNYECALKAFDASVKMGCTFFLGTGSQAEYGSTIGVVDENYPCNPNTEYGKEKLHTYRTLTERAAENNIRFIWTRIFSIYGKYDYSKTLIMSTIDKMKINEPVEMTLCTQLWDYLNVEDAVEAMRLFADSECEDGVYNVASGDYRPLKEFVEVIKDVTGSQSELKFGAIEYGVNGPINLTPDVKKIKKTLNWIPKIDFEEGIKEILNDLENKATIL